MYCTQCKRICDCVNNADYCDTCEAISDLTHTIAFRRILTDIQEELPAAPPIDGWIMLDEWQ